MKPNFVIATSLLAGLLIAASFLPVHAQSTSTEFTIVALPDTQYYAKSYPQIMNAQTNWIAANAARLNIRLVLGLGDIVDGGGDLNQWRNADSAYHALDGVVPYLAAQGNHDFDHNDVSGRTASSKNFNSYFGPTRYSGKSWYRGNFPAASNENFYGVFTFGARTYLILVLEPFPRTSSVTWARSVVAHNSDKDVIVVTHAYTYYDSTRMNRCDAESASNQGVPWDNDGEQLWQKLIQKYPNIVMVLSGHVVAGDGTGRRTDLGINGNVVNQMLSNYQAWANGGNGYLRLITIKPATNQVVVRTYSPYLNQWLTDTHNQFTVPYKRSGIATANGALTGKIKNIATCAALVGARVSNGTSTATTDAYGNFSLAVTGPANYSITVSVPGLATMPNSISMVPMQFSKGKLFMSPSGTIRGLVTNFGAPVAGATVNLSGGSLRASTSTKTMNDGTYRAVVPYGTYTATVNIGGVTKNVSATVIAAGVVTVNLAVQ